jgi:hypothetical protein
MRLEDIQLLVQTLLFFSLKLSFLEPQTIPNKEYQLLGYDAV